MIWRELESTIAVVAEEAVVAWMKKNPKQRAYAFAFHECYRELDGVITIPQLGVNSIQKNAFEGGEEDDGWKWNSADWHWLNILPTRSPLRKLEAVLTAEACRSSQKHWLKCEKRFYSILVRVAKLLYHKFSRNSQTTDDFVVYIDDEGDLDIIRLTVPAKLFDRHFAKFKKPLIDVKDIAPKELIKKYIDEIYIYGREIVALGRTAIVPLIKKLEDPENGHFAPDLLADINHPTKALIRALRKYTSVHSGLAESCSRALFLLGDVEYLFTLVGDDNTRLHAVRGIVTGLKARASEYKPPVPLDYRHVERLLAMDSPEIFQQLNQELAPGSSFIEILESDVDELLRGLSSPHTVIRQHAACISDRRSLGAKVGKRLLPVLAEKLRDHNPNVRRLTLIALARWKSAAKDYHQQMKLLQNDNDSLVREFAFYVFRPEF